jgi:hypothetical protein
VGVVGRRGGIIGGVIPPPDPFCGESDSCDGVSELAVRSAWTMAFVMEGTAGDGVDGAALAAAAALTLSRALTAVLKAECRDRTCTDNTKTLEPSTRGRAKAAGAN